MLLWSLAFIKTDFELLKEKLFSDTFKDGKADFIEDHRHKCKDNCNRISQWGKEVGSILNPAWASV